MACTRSLLLSLACLSSVLVAAHAWAASPLGFAPHAALKAGLRTKPPLFRSQGQSRATARVSGARMAGMQTDTKDRVYEEIPLAGEGTKTMKRTGTAAIQVEESDKNSVLDDMLGALFQVGGKLIFPNDDAVVAVGHLNDLIGDFPLFFPLQQYFFRAGGVYKLSFAPVSQATFYVISDAAAVKRILKEETFAFDKGLLAEILEPILGKGLIPADIETWKARRPVVQPGFHTKWLTRMAVTFDQCANVLAENLDDAAKKDEVVNLEALFNSVSLDIIGKAVFNYDFGSVTRESPVIRAAYACLQEAEHRSTFLLPYWNVPVLGSGEMSIIPRQREFALHLRVLKETLEEMVREARTLKVEADLEALEKRNYDEMTDPSLLRFLVDLRGGDCDDKQLRDDLMTLLVAGHETTGSLLTWTAFELAQNKEWMTKIQEEIDRVVGDGNIEFDHIKQLDVTRMALAESLRLYPQPPILLRRALEAVELPLSHAGEDPSTAGPDGVMQEKTVKLGKGANVFISVWNLHRNPNLWDEPNTFNPLRWDKKKEPFSDLTSWKGYEPRENPGMYPNEVDADFAYVPFGGGQRKCVGDQFAMMEAVVILGKVLQKFDIELAGKPEDVGMSTGATIHTKSGLNVRCVPRKNKK
mmetsp:Transcript_1603/g.4035  ORF Transcript_1603/g.4035 Transcript_1603/m.4035 type:complete len:641 (+) Transcript_1603:133-2055(+)